MWDHTEICSQAKTRGAVMSVGVNLYPHWYYLSLPMVNICINPVPHYISVFASCHWVVYTWLLCNCRPLGRRAILRLDVKWEVLDWWLMQNLPGCVTGNMIGSIHITPVPRTGGQVLSNRLSSRCHCTVQGLGCMSWNWSNTEMAHLWTQWDEWSKSKYWSYICERPDWSTEPSSNSTKLMLIRLSQVLIVWKRQRTSSLYARTGGYNDNKQYTDGGWLSYIDLSWNCAKCKGLSCCHKVQMTATDLTSYHHHNHHMF